MKKKILTLIFSISAILFLIGCEKGDGEKDYGFGLIYIPQATSDGGITNHYLVPSGGGEYSYNFIVNNDRLDIILGVLRSGKIGNESYSVTVSVDESESQLAVEDGSVSNAIVMPSSIYELPNKVDVPANKSGESFYLSVDINAIKGSTSYSGKNLVLEIAISNPTNFELAESNTSVLVVLDVDSIQEYL